MFEFSDFLATPPGFLAAMVVMSLLAVAAVAWPLWRKPATADEESERLAVLRDRRREIELDQAQGKLSAEDARLAIEALAVDLALGPLKTSTPTRTLSGWAVWPMVIMVPLIGWLAYAAVGAPAIVGIDPQAMQGEMDPKRLQEALQSLRERVEKNPEDREGWLLLGQAYRLAEDLPQAVAAYRKAAAGPAVSARLLAELAETLVMQNQGDFSGEPLRLLENAYAKDPNDQKTLGLLGAALYRTGQPARAIDVLQKLIGQLPPDSEQVRQMSQVVDRIKAEADTPSTTGSTTASAPSSNTGKPREITVRIGLDAAVLSQAPSAGALFVTARAAQGPRQPIAVQRVPITAELLTSLAKSTLVMDLNSSTLMDPQRGLDSVTDIVIEARLSASGQAIRQPGDLIGRAAPAKTGGKEQAQVVISERVQ